MRNVEEIIGRQLTRWNSVAQLLNKVPGQQTQAAPTPGQQHPVICISRDLGCGARIVAKSLAARLGYDIFGSQMIDAIARDLDVQRHMVDGLDESDKTGLRMMLETYMRGREIAPDEYLAALVRVVQTMAMRGGVILLGRGASFVLREKSALNVRLTAPMEIRIERLMQYEDMSRQEATAKIQEADRTRERFIKKYFGENVLVRAQAFDLGINLGRIAPADAPELILHALELRGYDLEKMALPLETAL